MALPVALHLAAASQLLPLTAGLVRRGRPLLAPARWVLAWCGLLVATDAVSLEIIRMDLSPSSPPAGGRTLDAAGRRRDAPEIRASRFPGLVFLITRDVRRRECVGRRSFAIP